MTWLSEIAEWDPPVRFTDVQLEGPYSLWRHTHSFLPRNGGTQIIDKIRYGLPLGPLGAIAHCLKVRRDLQAIFDYRALRTREIFAYELEFAGSNQPNSLASHR
jgi:ligand-binding SRPBCC domain-containing protein